MAHDVQPPAPVGVRRLRLPWVVGGAGAVVVFAGILVSGAQANLAMAFLAGGLLMLGVAVGQHLCAASWEFAGRLESAMLLFFSAVMAAGALFACPGDWDSARLPFAALALVAGVGSALVLMPRTFRRAAVSLLVVFHFGGMFISATSVDVLGAKPWITNQLLIRVYLPYLQFLYMTNAYHFYSPEPGAPAMLWYAGHYSDGHVAWLHVPDLDDNPTAMHYQRLLALPEHTFKPVIGLPLTDAQRLEYSLRNKGKELEGESWDRILERRLIGSRLYQPRPIPWVADLNYDVMYHAPSMDSKDLIRDTARRAFHELPKREGATLESVKVYRVELSIITPQELASGVSPIEENKYLPFFLGEFDADGKLLDPKDPFLYWYLPTVLVTKDYPRGYAEARSGVPSVNVRVPGPKGGVWLRSLELHANGPKPATWEGRKP
jgi:hypothetical protein